MNIPNTLTFARILSVPLLIWLIIDQDFYAAFVVFLLAGLSDAADGYLAKRYGWRTELGAYLDPIADKALLVAIYVALGISGHLPVWLVIIVVSRDILIVGAVLLAWMMGRPVEVKPLIVSKINTFTQIALAGFVLAQLGLGLGVSWLVSVLIWVTGGLTVLSALVYFFGWLRHMMSYEPEQPKPIHRPQAATRPKGVQAARAKGGNGASRPEVRTP
ncbi:CDP-alcohol phosphatidyltransferase family protein [Methyloceanibacter sp. wino2]|uniref:CDP-alcohol phosphatidyltransferase family protein n=1 Tax=Methyloceanibacter sp. wino2 TaxID=2170729 RepID=UPI000D3E1676|nr:CDP-alcohol phosphatidyltransferase family protein [Methyloceanibacter sp. wino2]